MIFEIIVQPSYAARPYLSSSDICVQQPDPGDMRRAKPSSGCPFDSLQVNLTIRDMASAASVDSLTYGSSSKEQRSYGIH
ncbi:hypothetical protein CVT25_010396 [Psilocybe cyanescens]|uniref:Uncharacterized protein n=1 Tax=Psilocybe cyanescens TaxID=93625 RepID=A0A409XDX2_PSICY|nr:hypothetical protein CVT25_010396 [Psilocybe cyanescens]